MTASPPTPPVSETFETVLVTGAAGFIGASVCALLLQQGRTVIGIDNINDAYDVRIKHWRLDQFQAHPGFTFYEADISEYNALAPIVEQHRPQAIINLAARAGVRASVENPWIYISTNTTGTLNLLELCRVHNVTKFVLASTSSLYGTHNPRPFREDADTNHPLSPYAASKKAAEVMCATYHALYNIDVTILRYFTVYGPAGRPDMSMFRFVQWISEGHPVQVYGDGTQSRDFTYITDIARGTVAGLKPLGYEIINLGSDTPVVLMAGLRLIERLVEQPAEIIYKPRHPADVMATWADIGKAERLLGWRPQTTFAEGVNNLVEWYRTNRDWASTIET
ncbi:MAG: NAD-dependent epimerase/dehydratase family protein [Chloroflexaceae bacterium]|nr:NAD-dependent epimerase/dehydratase family protein [Chloroflexaceae bacterium]NJO07835.1 NAD-dependent epimerase/dehydratase family protein [Chloroflexaceae bacterium]